MKKFHDKKTTATATVDYRNRYPKWNDEKKREWTILAPNMLPWHFDVIKDFLADEGYNIEILTKNDRTVIDEGLKHVHNDTCYPCMCVTGQFIDALKSGKYDLNHTALIITQSGGGCRASNYIPLITKAIHQQFPTVPVMSLNFAGLEGDNQMKVSLSLLAKFAYSIAYCDTVMWCYNQTKPYELVEGSADAMRDKAQEFIKSKFKQGGYTNHRRINQYVIDLFKSVPRDTTVKKPKVGIVGEIYVKYAPLGNNNLEKFLLDEGCEPVVPPLLDFILYCIVNVINDRKLYGYKGIKYPVYKVVYKFIRKIQKTVIKQLTDSGVFAPVHDFEHLRRLADVVINQGVKMGEGWLIPAEMAAFASTDTPNIVCAQPFGCLPNHIVGKGMVRTIKNLYPDSNIVAVDYDSSASRVNQENRIKLMISIAKKNQT